MSVTVAAKPQRDLKLQLSSNESFSHDSDQKNQTTGLEKFPWL